MQVCMLLPDLFRCACGLFFSAREPSFCFTLLCLLNTPIFPVSESFFGTCSEAESKDEKARNVFNCVQRAHQNSLENQVGWSLLVKVLAADEIFGVEHGSLECMHQH